MHKKLSLKEFLYLFTAIPRKFIDEYYSFYEMCKDEKFGIPLESVAKYLGIKSLIRLKTRIRDTYKLNSEYVIVRDIKKLTKGSMNAYYMLSLDGFEKLCLRSASKKGQEYIDYHNMLRSFIDYYKDNITDKLLELTKTSKFMYILAVNKDKDIFKIGRTGNIRKRLQAYATGRDKHPDIEFILIVKDDKQVEQCAKAFVKTKQYKGNKELYKANLDKLRHILVKCADIDDYVSDDINNRHSDVNKYIVYDNSKTVEYLNLDDEFIGMAKLPATLKKQNLIYNDKSKKTTRKLSKSNNL
jgi:hypothetical protein